MTYLSRHNMMPNKFDAAVKALALPEKLLVILTEQGPATVETLQYFLNRRSGITIEDVDLEHVLYGMGDEQVERARIPDTIRALYHLPGESGRQPHIPQPADYPAAFIDLYLRYQALRSNPDLAGMTDAYIDSLYLPQPEEGVN